MQLCGHEVGGRQPLFLIAGTCVIESEQMTMDVAGQLTSWVFHLSTSPLLIKPIVPRQRAIVDQV